jgi:hypothetical protein
MPDAETTENVPSTRAFSSIRHSFLKAPGAKTKRVYAKVKHRFDEPALSLQVLGRQKSALGPDDGLKSFH